MSYPFNVLPFVIAFVFLSALCMAEARKEEGAKARKEEGAKARKEEGTKARREEGAKARMEESTKARKEEGAKARRYSGFAVWAFLIIAPVTIALCMCRIYPLSGAYKKWNSTKMLYNMNLHKEAAEEYAGQHPYLQDEIRFLFEYAQSLSKSEQYKESNKVLRRAMQISCDPMLYNSMGKNCQALKEYERAEQNFRKAANLVPNRLYPHYLLAKLYHEMRLKDKMEQEINIVMTKTPKVESMAVEEMREELKTFLNDER
jgi:tetratricopeptide (TPR) repeat protein